MAFKMSPKSPALKMGGSKEDMKSNKEPKYMERAEINSEKMSPTKKMEC
jgi:hypothetical protein